jgi:hypothetical protein
MNLRSDQTSSDDDFRQLQVQVDELKAQLRSHRRWIVGSLATFVATAALGMAGNPNDISCDKLRARSIVLVDPNNRARMIAQCGADGTAGIGWLDPQGQARVMIDTFNTGTAQFTLNDASGKPRLIAKSAADGSAGIGWLDSAGSVRIGATTFADGSVAIPNCDLTPPKRP